MNNQNSYSPGNRSRRGGGNRRGGSRRTSSNYNRNRPPQKKSFWQKFLAFFGFGKSKPKSTISSKPQHPAYKSERAERAEQAPRETRKPELVEVTSAKIYVGNLSFDATESDLTELFNGVGQVQNAEIISHRHTQKSKGFAFVTMQTVEEAKRAVEVLNDKDFMGRKLVVSGAKTSDVRHAA